MSSSTLPRPCRPADTRRLRGPVSDDFEAFYRAELRYSFGARIEAMEIVRRFNDWARRESRGSIGPRELKAYMLRIGHRSRKSNRTWYLDVCTAAAAPHLEDNFPEALVVPPASAGAIARIDAIAAELVKLRRDVSAGRA